MSALASSLTQPHVLPAAPTHDRYEREPVRHIGDFVATEHGCGHIVGKDLPNSRVWRWVVHIVEPAAGQDCVVERIGPRLSYFPWEVRTPGRPKAHPAGHQLYLRADGSAWVGERWRGRFPAEAMRFAELPQADDPRWIPGEPSVVGQQVLTLCPFYPSGTLGVCVEERHERHGMRNLNHPPFIGAWAWMPLDAINATPVPAA